MYPITKTDDVFDVRPAVITSFPTKKIYNNKKKTVLLVPPELSPIGIDPSTSRLAGGYLVHMASVDKMPV